MAALEAVLRYRLYWFADTTAVDICRVSRISRSPNGVGAIVDARARALIIAHGNCRDPGYARRDFVSVGSIVVEGYVGTVELSVQHGDYAHHETYHLLGDPWYVDSMVARGQITVSRVSPGR